MNQLICIAKQLTGFYMIQAFTESYFPTDFSRKYLCFMKIDLSIYIFFCFSVLPIMISLFSNSKKAL